MYFKTRSSRILQLCRLVMCICLFCTVLGSAVLSKVWFLSLVASYSKHEGKQRMEYATKIALSVTIPYCITLLSSLVKVSFNTTKPQKPLSKEDILPRLLLETLQTLGLSLLLFKVLPYFDTLTCIVVILALGTAPPLMKLFVKALSTVRLSAYRLAFLLITVLILVLLTQTNYILEPCNDALRENVFSPKLAFLAACGCLSLRWWLNITKGKLTKYKRWFTLDVHDFRRCLGNNHDMVNIVVSLVKFVTLTLSTICFVSGQRLDMYAMITGFVFGNKSVTGGLLTWQEIYAEYFQVINVFICSIVFMQSTKLACKLKMHHAAFLLPVVLVSPLSILLVFLKCQHKLELDGILPAEMHCPNPEFASLKICLILGVLTWISLVLVTWHIWKPQCEGVEKFDGLIVRSQSDYVINDISIVFQANNDTEKESSGECTDGKINNAEEPPTIYLCATMWHENRQEMLRLLKSMFRIDTHCTSSRLANNPHSADTGRFDPEIHIVFDDAFEVDMRTKQKVPNHFVEQLVGCFDEILAEYVTEGVSTCYDKTPEITSLPYGGQLTWTMPGGTHMVVHLKDKSKVKHRKRWSQVMYMYYLLGYKVHGHTTVNELVQRDSKERSPASRQKLSNTFILTIDGDVDFQPESVLLLLERMKTDRQIGAVCGRLHPVGSGPMVWYQIFEYAIGHWFSKTTEHMFGSVLCCPGCFSLFRGSALMDERVLKTFTTEPSEALEYIQFEQGEDRWLTTLLITHGYKTDYVADAYALTNAPDTFKEFFIQRRRWVSSQLPNDIDLLKCWWRRMDTKSNIRKRSIVYHFIMMVSNYIVPSGLSLVILALLSSLLGLDWLSSGFISVSPCVIYMFICLHCEQDVQIKAGSVLTALYAFGVSVVISGAVVNTATGAFMSMDFLVFGGVCTIFTIEALFHPKEITCLPHIFFYIVTYLPIQSFMIMYCVCNLNNVSWGTRETANNQNETCNESDVSTCYKDINNNKRLPKQHIAPLIKRPLVRSLSDMIRQYFTKGSTICTKQNENIEEAALVIESKSDSGDVDAVKTDNKLLTVWAELDKCNVAGNTEETNFWHGLMGKYLQPINVSKARQIKISNDLLALRDDMVYIFFLVNISILLALTLLQLEKKNIRSFFFLEKYDPLSVVSLIPFISGICIHFIAMIYERWGTFQHLIANTTLWSSGGAAFKPTSNRKHNPSNNYKVHTFIDIEPDFSNDLDKQIYDVFSV